MRGAPWDGAFYGFVIVALVLFGAVVMALSSQDFLTRALAWAVAAACLLGAVRTIRRALRSPQAEHPTGRWWFGG